MILAGKGGGFLTTTTPSVKLDRITEIILQGAEQLISAFRADFTVRNADHQDYFWEVRGRCEQLKLHLEAGLSGYHVERLPAAQRELLEEYRGWALVFLDAVANLYAARSDHETARKLYTYREQLVDMHPLPEGMEHFKQPPQLRDEEVLDHDC